LPMLSSLFSVRDLSPDYHFFASLILSFSHFSRVGEIILLSEISGRLGSVAQHESFCPQFSENHSMIGILGRFGEGGRG
ncbi:MAG: hypothetical protein ACRDHZ_17585, partial [Ktedonobacteraceae bacterium]